MWPDERTRSSQRLRVTQASRALPIASPANMPPVQVVAREEIAPDTISVLIVLPGTRQAPAPYLPGQFVTLALPTQRETLYRSYSLCGAGSPDQPTSTPRPAQPTAPPSGTADARQGYGDPRRHSPPPRADQ